MFEQLKNKTILTKEGACNDPLFLMGKQIWHKIFFCELKYQRQHCFTYSIDETITAEVILFVLIRKEIIVTGVRSSLFIILNIA